MSDLLFLRSGHNVSISTKTNVSLCSDKKGQGPKKAQPSPSEIQVLVKRRGVPAGAGYPAQGMYGQHSSLGPPASAQPSWGGSSQLEVPSGVHTLPSHHDRGLQLPLRILRPPKSGLHPMNCNPWRPLPPLGRRGRHKGRSRPWLKTCAGQWEAGVRARELCRTQPSSCPWDPQLTRQPETRQPGGPWGGDCDLPV